MDSNIIIKQRKITLKYRKIFEFYLVVEGREAF